MLSRSTKVFACSSVTKIFAVALFPLMQATYVIGATYRHYSYYDEGLAHPGQLTEAQSANLADRFLVLRNPNFRLNSKGLPELANFRELSADYKMEMVDKIKNFIRSLSMEGSIFHLDLLVRAISPNFFGVLLHTNGFLVYDAVKSAVMFHWRSNQQPSITGLLNESKRRVSQLSQALQNKFNEQFKPELNGVFVEPALLQILFGLYEEKATHTNPYAWILYPEEDQQAIADNQED